MDKNGQQDPQQQVQHPLDETAFRLLFDLYWKRLLAFCQHHTHDDDAAMDMVQDIFCSLWKRRETLQISVSMEYYLFRAARIKISDHFREKFKRTERENCLAEQFCETVNNTEETIYYKDLDHFVDGLVNRLPCRCRQVYTLSRNSGLNIREIAEQLSISEKTVEAHLTKALGFLKKNLDGQLDSK
ncbi:RNA polymerase sigma-70 factor [Parapedobacter koreensis]|uniref:RNA polymerase sigma-70 factor, ECF subfamily n=1 Tax=Parapedobacter koreensis TaxID=332977 RepID=A0A1H7JUS8_9SPHI|nr:RNA polymerase sigma-70 factor [Parapedobacter koreensis]SEK78124.1 RNA polymerase sigma-70 factor, ECF subfamily [Parapedobacter koreensis]